MGCSASRPAVKTHHFLDEPSSSSSPKVLVTRAFSLPTPLVHHPPLTKGDTHHLVSLTSTTYGSLRLLHHHDDADHSPRSDSLSPHSVINAWELMDGLDDEDESPFNLGNSPQSPQLTTHNSQVINFQKKSHPDFHDQSQSKSKPLWKYLSEESLLSKMDPVVDSSYRRALSYRESETHYSNNNVARCSSPSFQSVNKVVSEEEDNQILIYFTSLRGIRKTYEDCCAVRMIFRGLRVGAVDERDISMDSNYRKELQSLLGGKVMSLPRVFIRGRDVGGVEEIKVLNESGELGKLLDGFPMGEYPRRICECCGDARFMPCLHCNGSRKIFEEATRELRRCVDCNENGLVRCPGC